MTADHGKDFGSADTNPCDSKVIVFLLICLASTVYLGCIHERGAFLNDLDMHVWYASGVAWWAGASPYSHAVFTESWINQFGYSLNDTSFCLAPTMLPLSLILAAMPWEAARWVMRSINLVCLIGTVIVLWRLLCEMRPRSETEGKRTFFLAAALAVPAATITLHQGQLALIMGLGVALSWLGLHQKRSWLVIAGFYLASYQPQAAMVPLLFLIAHYRHRSTAYGLGVVLALSSLVILWTTPAQFAVDLQQSLEVHMHQKFNQPHHYDSVAGLIGDTPIGRWAMALGLVAGCSLALWIGQFARATDSPTQKVRLMQIVIALTTVTMPLHHYDFTIDMILLATAWVLGSTRRALILCMLVYAHGRSYWLGHMFNGHVLWRLDLSGDPMTAASHFASLMGVVVLAFLMYCWVADRRLTLAKDSTLCGSADRR
jgi:hypothetical protein